MEYKQCEHMIEPRPGRVNEITHRCELEVSKIDKAGKYCARHSPEGKAVKAEKDRKRDEERDNYLREKEIEHARETLNIKIAESIKLLIDNGYSIFAQNMEWKPIETCPFQTPVLLFTNFGVEFFIFKKEFDGTWVTMFKNEIITVRPTHWMAMPLPPNAGHEGQAGSLACPAR